jgi:hypothetical protein
MSTKPMMGCGHRQNARTGDGRPACAICTGTDPLALVVVQDPSLEGRLARCMCGNTRPSIESEDGSLAFFEFRGEGSPKAKQMCKHCRYYEVAHRPEKNHDCKTFEPHGAFEFDEYYCGCRGWD